MNQAARPECCVEGFRVPTLPRDVAQPHPHVSLGPRSRHRPLHRPAHPRHSATLAGRRAATTGGGHDRSANHPRAGAPRSRTGELAGVHQEAGKGVRLLARVIDPDPLLVITPDGAIEYANERKPLTVVNFHDLAGITLQARGSSFSDSTIVTLDVWIDLHYRDSRKTKWRSTSFADNLQTIQCFIEAYGAHKALREH